jgi:hypothetical protein
MTIKELRNPEVLEEITKMRALGSSYKAISDYLSTEFNLDVHQNSIRKMYTQLGKTSTNMIKANDEVKAILQSEVLDTTTELKMLTTRLHNMLDELEDSKNKNKVPHMIMAMAEIRKILELQAKLMQKINDQPKAQHINYIDQSVKIIGQLEGLEKEGFIKVLKDLPKYQ